MDAIDNLDRDLAFLRGMKNRTTAQDIVFDTLSAKKISYQQVISPYATTGRLMEDLINDIHGPTVHRLQVIVWTLALGVTFVVDCYTSNAMPQFSDRLLALMTLSGGVYAGFKVPERQV